jgi:hypothetical protein
MRPADPRLLALIDRNPEDYRRVLTEPYPDDATFVPWFRNSPYREYIRDSQAPKTSPVADHGEQMADWFARNSSLEGDPSATSTLVGGVEVERAPERTTIRVGVRR